MAFKNSIIYEHSLFSSQRNNDPVIIKLAEETLWVWQENDLLLKLCVYVIIFSVSRKNISKSLKNMRMECLWVLF